MSTLPAWARRLLTKELRFVAEGMEFDREAAQKILPLLAPRKKNEKQKSKCKEEGWGCSGRRGQLEGDSQRRAGTVRTTERCLLRGVHDAAAWPRRVGSLAGRYRATQAARVGRYDVAPVSHVPRGAD
jgi:hypothetical protein